MKKTIVILLVLIAVLIITTTVQSLKIENLENKVYETQHDLLLQLNRQKNSFDAKLDVLNDFDNILIKRLATRDSMIYELRKKVDILERREKWNSVLILENAEDYHWINEKYWDAKH